MNINPSLCTVGRWHWSIEGNIYPGMHASVVARAHRHRKMEGNIRQVLCVLGKWHRPTISILSEATLVMDCRIKICLCISLRWCLAWTYRISHGMCVSHSVNQYWTSRIDFGLHIISCWCHTWAVGLCRDLHSCRGLQILSVAFTPHLIDVELVH